MLRTIHLLHAVVKNVSKNHEELVMLFSCFSRKFFWFYHVLIETAAKIMLKRSDWLSQCLTHCCDPSLSLNFFCQPEKAIRLKVDGQAHLNTMTQFSIFVFMHISSQYVR